MALYAIGDVQGCLSALQALLEQTGFDPARDRLWFAGDLVARGPDSLGVLRFVKSLGATAESVLGNHDLHLLAVHYGLAQPKARDLTQPIFSAPDRDELMAWLRQRPLCLHDAAHNCVLTHAGIPPGWSLPATLARAAEVEAALQGPDIQTFFGAMYGNEPAAWDDSLSGPTRLRVITNFLTRMRLINSQGAMDFAYKEDLVGIPPGLTPWFKLPSATPDTLRILFGHWAALGGITEHARIIALDTGCVWGGRLSAYRVDDGQSFSTHCGCDRPAN